MAVLVEAISVIIKRDVIEARYPGGWDGFVATAPNRTLCADTALVRVGFMVPADVDQFVSVLARSGIVYLKDGLAQGLCVVDQLGGCMVQCDWLDVGRVDVTGDATGQVTVARAVGDLETWFAAPDGWVFDGSLSQTWLFVPTGQESKGLRFLRHEHGLDVYLNLVTGREVYAGRTSRTDA